MIQLPRSVTRWPSAERYTEIEALAASTDLSIRRIHEKIQGKASRGIVGEIAKRIRSGRPTAL
ncbi:hypothetical protein [Azospirillum sp. Marseille-Q6669]